MSPEQPTLTERLVSLWDHLGLKAAHVATQMPGDVADFARSHPGRIAGLLLCVPSRLDPTPFAAVAARTVMISGERGMTDEVTARAEPRLPGSRRVVLADYDAPGWADVVADRGETIAERSARPARRGDGARTWPKARAVHAGISYQVHGRARRWCCCRSFWPRRNGSR